MAAHNIETCNATRSRLRSSGKFKSSIRAADYTANYNVAIASKDSQSSIAKGRKKNASSSDAKADKTETRATANEAGNEPKRRRGRPRKVKISLIFLRFKVDMSS